ncbi:MAG: hypothetical protein KAW49_02830 [Anaerolineae bacterium]|nr:hypothetical protein [Anaerolineae bacterium]
MADVQVEQNRAFGGVIDIFEATGIEYVIWGGVAVVTYGEPRFTRDMDVVVRLRYSEADTLARLLEETGYSVSVEAIRDAVDRYFYFNAIHLETGIKVDFYVAPRDPIYAWAFKHRRVKNFDEFRQAAYMPPESVILTKLQAYQESSSTRHLEGAESILRVSGPELDLAYVHREAARIGVFGTWRELLERSGLGRRGVRSGGRT